MKIITDMLLAENHPLGNNYGLLILESGRPLPEIVPGQFVEVAVPECRSAMLRRPISICNVEPESRRIWMLVRRAGEGTARLLAAPAGTGINVVMPLGHGFTFPTEAPATTLLVGGGVGVAPLLYLGAELLRAGHRPEFLLGARSENDLLLIDEFRKIGPVHTATDDGSAGHHGLVTTHPRLRQHADIIYCCGPAPMMKAVAAVAREVGTPCEVSLENMMACGLGACLCCVEKTVKGNVCVCTEGPVFNINQLTWD